MLQTITSQTNQIMPKNPPQSRHFKLPSTHCVCTIHQTMVDNGEIALVHGPTMASIVGRPLVAVVGKQYQGIDVKYCQT